MRSKGANREAEALTCHSEPRKWARGPGASREGGQFRTVRIDVWYLDVCYVTQLGHSDTVISKVNSPLEPEFPSKFFQVVRER